MIGQVLDQQVAVGAGRLKAPQVGLQVHDPIAGRTFGDVEDKGFLDAHVLDVPADDVGIEQIKGAV